MLYIHGISLESIQKAYLLNYKQLNWTKRDSVSISLYLKLLII